LGHPCDIKPVMFIVCAKNCINPHAHKPLTKLARFSNTRYHLYYMELVQLLLSEIRVFHIIDCKKSDLLCATLVEILVGGSTVRIPTPATRISLAVCTCTKIFGPHLRVVTASQPHIGPITSLVSIGCIINSISVVGPRTLLQAQ
jgi:hypothetical protein